MEELPDAQAGPGVPVLSLGSHLVSFSERNKGPADAEQIPFNGYIFTPSRNGSSLANNKLDNNLGSSGRADFGLAPCCQRLSDVQHDPGLHVCSGGLVGAVRGWSGGGGGRMAIDSCKAPEN